TTQLPGGKQLSRPENVSGAYSINGNFNFGLPIKRMQGGNINTTTRFNYDRNVGLLNGRKNYSKNALIGQDLRLNYNFKELVDVGLSGGLNWNSVQYTIQQDRNDNYYTKVFSIDATYSSPKGFILSSDFDYTAYAGRADGFNQAYSMWNASVGQQLFKSKRGEVKLSVYDLLKQNQSITREATENYIEDVQNTVLQRFFLLSFTYKLNRMGGKNMPVQQSSRGREMRMRY
ncbi:MAG TPA: outer membrane beta-barrel protein, partial [Chitinophagaceae bacterium]